jgi:hypothetical protein
MQGGDDACEYRAASALPTPASAAERQPGISRRKNRLKNLIFLSRLADLFDGATLLWPVKVANLWFQAWHNHGAADVNS